MGSSPSKVTVDPLLENEENITENVFTTRAQRYAPFVLYVALEMGTTYSGYAYSFKTNIKLNIEENPEYVGRYTGSWKFGSHMKKMTYTSVLFHPDKTFHSYGFEAEEFYYNNPQNVDFHKWFFFKRFKLVLNNKDILTEATVIADNGGFGNKMKAIDVVAGFINGMMEDLFRQLTTDLLHSVAIHNISWTLTVPAIWTKGGRQFLMNAAVQTGIPEEQLTLILEPEAAFWFCNNIPLEVADASFEMQSEYIVLHQGGKTTLITIHEGIGPTALKKVYETYGGDVVETEFVRFLARFLGETVLKKLQKNHAREFFTFIRSARIEICRCENNLVEDVKIAFPNTLIHAIKSYTGKPVNALIKSSRAPFVDKVHLMKGILTIHRNVAITCLNAFIQKVVKTLEEVLDDPSVSNRPTLIGLGEYEESFELALLFKAIHEKFPHINRIVPSPPEFAVLRGAVFYAYDTHESTGLLSPTVNNQVASEQLSSRLPKMNVHDFKTLIANGDYASFENRVYLAGACNVGKSCLASILIGEKIPKKWSSTDGLTIYFGRNGIHLENREMIPLTKSPFETSIVQKVLLGNAVSDENSDGVKVFRKIEDEQNKFENVERGATKTDLTNDDEDDNENQKQPKSDQEEKMETNKENLKKKKKKEIPHPNIVQQTSASIHKNILQQLRKGNYKVEIAPSDLVDFGGQRTYDMTHQLFIQHQGTFVLMFDGRYGLKEPLEEYGQGHMTAEDILIHWVNSILLYCKDDDDIMPMILFAATHSDLLETDVQTEQKNLKQELLHLFSSHVKCKHIMLDRIFFINATDPFDPEIKILKDTLVDIAFNQSTWGQKMPLAWVPLELQISEMRTKNINLVSKGKLQEINQLNEEFTLSEYSLEEFLRIQHSFGKILYFDTPGLNDFIVVQPTVMVNILRSFINDKLFWPKRKDLRLILENMSSTGKVQKSHLFQIWSQPQFREFVPTLQHKEYITQVLVHLDILVEPHADNKGGTSEVSYFVPCVVQSKLPTDLLPTDEKKTICLAYHLRDSLVPSALTFKLIAAPVTIWPLKEINGRLCLYFQSAILNIDESNQLLVMIKGQKVIIYLSNKVSRHLISPDIAASIQECLTAALQRVLYFYNDCFGKRFINMDVVSLFETEVGMLCTNDACLVPLYVAKKNGTWVCEKGRRHESKYCLYWVFDKEKKICNPTCKGLEADALALHPNDKHLVRLAEQIGITVFDQFIIHLGLTREEWENIEYQYIRNGPLGVQLMALYEYKRKKQKILQTLCLQDLLDALTEIGRPHSLCQIFREETNLIGIAESALQNTPTDEVLNRLPRQLGNCVIQLGIELGLSFNSIEETMYNYSKDMYSQLYDILKKWKQASKEKTSVYTLMKALQRTDSGGLTFLREQYEKS